ncbi:hypothetical protein [Azospirillum sp. ST 5-10]|uniref:hypothetical protein n=1 Tax=unclassified Azospirillum TaxID=2630922 RepID=UPI003F4A649E
MAAATSPLPPAGAAASLADSLIALARRRGVPPADDATILDVLAALEPHPLIPHELLLVAGTVLAGAFRQDRLLAEPPAGPADDLPSADCSL